MSLFRLRFLRPVLRLDACNVLVSPFGPLIGDRPAFDHVVDGLGDVGGVVADALDVLGAEQQMVQSVILRGSSIM